MKSTLLAVPLAIVAGVALFGCQNTAEGAAEDTANHVNAASNVADNAGEAAAQATSNTVNAVGNVADNAGEAAAQGAQAVVNGVSNAGDAVANVAEAAPVTGKVKLAITANHALNTDGNLVDVDTKNGIVTLSGHVKTAEMKMTAEKIAQKVITDNHYSEKVVNKLTVGS